MSEFEPPIYEAGAFWRQVKRGISGLVLPENVSDPKNEAAAWRSICMGKLLRRPQWRGSSS